MDVLSDALVKFWNALNRHHVRYIMIGGFATRFHGFNRSTDDLDLWLDDSVSNRNALRLAFAELGYGDYPQFETMTFIPGWTDFVIADAVAVDILTEMKGLSLGFNDSLAIASVAEIENTKIPFLHIGQLIENKRFVNRPKDQVDVIELEKIKALREK